MTYPEFLEKLKQTPRGWVRVGSRGTIRLLDNNLCKCPITSLCDEFPVSAMYGYAGKKLGLRSDLVSEIARAADNSMMKFNPATRADLLAACGLEN